MEIEHARNKGCFVFGLADYECAVKVGFETVERS
jgi:hypothetical protein